MRQGQTDLQIAVEISNDFGKLVPLGSLLYVGIPSSDYAFQGIKLSASSWSYFDAEFLHDVYGVKLHPSLQALVFLIRNRVFSATYKAFRYKIGKLTPFTLWKVRVYAVAQDIDGSRFIRQWRSGWSNNHSVFQKRCNNFWKSLLYYMDFSSEGWSQIPRSKKSMCNFPTVICIPFFAPNFKILNETKYLYHHMRRWSLGKSLSELWQEQEPLETVIRKVYGQIQTPDLSSYSNSSLPDYCGAPSAEEAISVLLHKSKQGVSSINGISSSLYPFQLRSVCKMYEKESISRREHVPHFIKFESPTGSVYYYDTLNHGFYIMPELYTVPKGGILAENMGLGKTLICLALVCLTKHEISTIPQDIILSDSAPKTASQKPEPIKTLANLCLESIAQNSLPWKYFIQDLPPTVIRKLVDSPGAFYVSVNGPQDHLGLRGRGGGRIGAKPSTKKLLLTSSTLVVVPENLLHQWNDEAKRHVEASFLKRLFISERFKSSIHHENSDYVSSPPQDPQLLMSYDLVVISVPLFSKMSSDTENVFMKIHWKRLVIDEGHSMSSRTSNLSLSCKLLYSERRWVVTGTPTSGLTNLHMEEDTEKSTVESPSKKRRKYVVKEKFNVREDLGKLGNLMSNYFKIEPFHSQPGLWTSSIVKNLSNANQLTAKLSLQNLLNSLMVRHSQSQVEADLVLPQLHHEAIFLEPSFQNKLAINLFTSVLAVNAISSERVGGDYMFDPSNRQQLHRLVNNLQLATFYWTGFQVSDVNSLASIAEHCLQKKTSSGQSYYSPEDRHLLENSLVAVKQALRNSRWKSAAMLHEMQFYVSKLPSPYISSFGTGSIPGIGIFGAPQLNEVQKFFYKNRFLPSGDHDSLYLRLVESSTLFWKEYWLRSQKKESGKFPKAKAPSEFDSHKVREDGVIIASKVAQTSDVHAEETTYFRPNSDSEFTYGNLSLDSKPWEVCLDPKLAKILGTASSKLSYLASRLMGHQKEGTKSIVFFEYEDSAYYLTELLDILGIKYILYATFIGAERRPNNLNDFASFDSRTKGGITLIMDLKLASHGLTVIAATRVYFINPVWHRSVEAQAIKRAHRIGQTNEVYVETLVLRGTLEEEIYRRRVEGETMPETGNEGSQKKYVIDDTGMQEFVLKHEFLPVNDNEQEYAGFSDHVSITTSKLEEFDEERISEFSLPTHSSEIVVSNGQKRRNWTMRLFNGGNLQKHSEAKQSRPDLDQLNMEFVEGKHDQSPTLKSVKKVPRKSVRF